MAHAQKQEYTPSYEHPPQPSPEHFQYTPGAADLVWIHTDPYSNRPNISKLDHDLDTDIHPTKYLVSLLNWLKEQPNFKCFTCSRVMDISEKGIDIGPIGRKTVKVKTDDGHTVSCGKAVMCIAIKIPKKYVEDCLLYDLAEEYKYIRMTQCDAEHDYMVVGGCDHAVEQEEPIGRFRELEDWTRERFTKAGTVDYAWSGQVFEPMDYMAFIGRDPGTKHTWIGMTGDSGNGLTHGVLSSAIIASEIEGKAHPWSKLYQPQRMASILKTAKETLAHDVQINAQYKRFLQTDIHDIEDLPNGEGDVLNTRMGKPTAVYKDDEGGLHKVSALCPHLKGVVCWNRSEKSWDCPIHGSRFSKDGIQIIGLVKGNMDPADESASMLQQQAGQA